MRQRITELNTFPVFDLRKEHSKIHTLFSNDISFGKPIGTSTIKPCYSYLGVLEIFFLDWKLRGTFTTCEEMLSSLHISDADFHRKVTEENTLDFIQFVLNAVEYVDHIVDDNDYGVFCTNTSIGRTIRENCLALLERMHTEADFDDKEIFVVYKNDLANAVLMEHPERATSIIDYLKIDTRGDVIRKEEILCTLAKELEPIEKTLNAMEFKPLCEDTTFLLNKFARHWQNPDQKIEAKIRQMSEREIEEWCDKAFNLFLACMAVFPYVQIKKEIKDLKTF